MRRIGLILLTGLLFVAAGLRDAADRWIDRTDLPMVLAETSTEVWDRNGNLLRTYQVGDGIWRLGASPQDVDAEFLTMLIRYEDKRFWSHTGVDAVALVRAAFQALTNRSLVSGGSTLTMQVARLLEDGSTGRWAGKLRQIRVALALERRLSKQDILQLYLTHAPYGGNLEGVRAATLAWFGKEPARLTPAQSALLIALPQSPETRRSDRNPRSAIAARNRVLARMAQQGVLTGMAAGSARTETMPRVMQAFPRHAAHLADEMRAADPVARRHVSTLDLGAQRAFEVLAREAALQAGPRLSVAIVAADHESGRIVASVGSPGIDDQDRLGFVDMARAIRSPGSTLKPLIYGLAFDQGLAHPETLIHDGPVAFGRYAPRNFDGLYRGDVRVRDALQMSLNIPVVKLAQELGPARIMAALHRSGTDPQLPGGAPGLAIALGGVGLSLRDLVQLYAGLAQGGHGPALHVLANDTGQSPEPVMSATAAWQVGNILSGLAPPPGAPAGVLAYKTGTSYGHRDAWAIGFDGRHVIGVWMGRADGTPVPGAFGGDLAAPVLFEAFGRLKPAFDPLPPPPPDTLIVSTAELPLPLRRFRPRGAVFDLVANSPDLVFPPDGAQLFLAGAPLTVKLRGGRPPFAILANGQPLATGVRLQEIDVPNPGSGFSTLVIVDGSGQSDSVTIRVD